MAAQPRRLACVECGASIIVPRMQSIEHCPFCGSPRFEPVFATAEPALSLFLPFELPPDRAIPIYRQWLGTRLFRPHGVNHEAIGQLRAVYIPAWLCRATATSTWPVPGDTTETETPTSAQHVAAYPHILISASRGLPADWLIDLGGFALNHVRPIHQAALRDSIIEIAAVDRGTALVAARRQIETIERTACATLSPDLPAASVQVQTTIADPTADLVGLPLWVASFTFRGAPYRCLINGQTGTVYGEAPVSGTKIAILVGIVILAIVAVLIVTQLYGS